MGLTLLVPTDEMTSDFNDLFIADIAASLDVPPESITIITVVIDTEGGIDTTDVTYTVEVPEMEDYTTEEAANILIQTMETLVDDTSSDLYQGDVTQYTDPDSFQVIDVVIEESSSSSVSARTRAAGILVSALCVCSVALVGIL
ncbi:hypothetical protein Pelo_10849 [Pelomyxa schiedti]|nr:hypothetical protein Pelo_10849 [Pelomyxa schiedti]